MKKRILIPITRLPRVVLTLLTYAFLSLLVCAGGNAAAQSSSAHIQEFPMKIRLIIGDEVTIAVLYDNATARDFATLLPLSLTVTDYARIERVSDLPHKLSTQGAPEGMTPKAGDLTHYAPWGNLAIFIEPRSYSRSLLPLGRVEEGLSILAQPGPYEMRIEPV